MRIALLAASAAAAFLGGCGGPETSQANSAQVNISNSAAPPATATASAAPPIDMAPVTGNQAKAVFHERHEGMEAVGKANKAIKRELDGGSPDLAVVRASAGKIADLSRKGSGWFHAGTGAELGKTGAKPEIWQSPQDFTAKLGDFQKSAQAFATIAAGTDVNAIKAGFADMGKTCKACHDKYRSEMHH